MSDKSSSTGWREELIEWAMRHRVPPAALHDPLLPSILERQVDALREERKRQREEVEEVDASPTAAERTTSHPPPRIHSLSSSSLSPPRGDSRIVDVTGDLMTSPDSLAHCVSACMAMGKGIAVLFKKRFGRVDALKAQQAGVGGLATLDLRQDGKENRCVYYLVTKPLYHHKPTYASLESSVRKMFQHMVENGVKRVAIPEIGCGLDLLEWPKVLADLGRVLAEFPAVERVTVYHFPKKS